jgi:ABC-type Fe3+/spermidine/putrescine transport system ATPase subunit
MTLADRIVVLRSGIIEQVGTPLEIYAAPRNRFVAGFMGAANIFEGRVTRGAGGNSMVMASGESLPCTTGHAAVGPACLVVRPEHIKVLDASAATGLPGRVLEVVYFGQAARIHIQTDFGMPLVAISDGLQSFPVPGQPVKMDWSPEHTWLMAA